MKMWAGRFRQPLDPGFERWHRSFEFDRRLLASESAGSGAHAGAVKNAGIVSSDELISILQGLDQITEQAAMSPAFLDDDEAEDVLHFVEKQLVVMIGDVGYKLHSGRSRNEQIATDLRLYVRASIDDLRLKLAEWLDALVSRAEQAGNAAMPAYTHLRRAEPVLVSHWVLAYVEMFLRDAERLADCRARVNICLLVAVKGLPLAYNKDLQETQQPLFDASETVLSVLPLIAGFMKVVEFDYDRMQKTAESGFMNAWAAATYLVERGVPFRVAHEQIGKAVQLCVVGCGALHLYGLHLAEIRSITVDPAHQGSGGGKLLVRALLSQAKKHAVTCICLFTRKPEFFSQLGFAMAQREDLPDKIYKDCCVCPRFHCCDEVAMVRGELPKFAILPEPTNWQVKLQA